jgi:hypothetical protein
MTESRFIVASLLRLHSRINVYEPQLIGKGVIPGLPDSRTDHPMCLIDDNFSRFSGN